MDAERDTERAADLSRLRDWKPGARAAEIRKKLQDFATEHISDGRPLEHAFVPWFLFNRFKLSIPEAIAQSSDGRADLGIDGYHFDRSNGEMTLWVIQAKLTEYYQGIISGLGDLHRAVDHVGDLVLTGETLKADENRVVSNLRAALASLTPQERSALRMTFCLLHLIEEDQEAWASKPKVRELMQRFNRQAIDRGFGGRAQIEFIGPDELRYRAIVVPKAAEPVQIRFEGMPVHLEGAQCYFGVGHLADLVHLYDKYRVELFAKNVRMYLYRQAEREQGAARQIRKTLEAICSEDPKGGLTTDHFPIMHNGIVLWSPAAAPMKGAGLMLEPGDQGLYVLNGCQTIYTAWNVLEKAKTKQGSWLSRWDSIRIPLRVLVSRDEDLVRRVTISTNRQNQIPPTAFWAHDPVQIDIERQLRRLGVFYERQEGALEHRRRADPKGMPETYSCESPITMVELARAIAASDRAVPIGFAASPLRIFDSETQYRKVFSDRNLRWPSLLILLVNLLRATRLALNEIRNNAADNSELGDLKPGSLSVPTLRLLVHYIAWMWKRGELKAGDLDWAAREALSTRSGLMRALRDWTRRQLRHQNSGIQQVLRDYWYDEDQDKWTGYSEKGRLETALGRQRWGTTAVFEDWNGLETAVASTSSPLD